MTASEPLSVSDRLSRRSDVALAMCAFAMLLDGFDIFLVGSLGPAIAAHFQVAPNKLTLVFLLQQVGMAVGAFAISPVADRVGRRKVLLVCVATFGALTLTAIASRTLLEFAVLRGLAGIFLSGAIPNAVALLVETTPRRRHGVFVAIAFTGYGTGTVGGALVAAFLLKNHGWHIGFLIGGLAPFVYLALALFLVPESLRFLLRRKPDHPSARARLSRLDPSARQAALAEAAAESGASPSASPRRSGTPLDVFRHGRGVTTCLLWAIYLLTFGTFALTLAWMPTLYTLRGGVALEAYSKMAAVPLVSALAGSLLVGFALDRIRPTRVLAACFLLSALSMTMLAHAPFGTLPFPFALGAMICFLGAGQTGNSAFAAQFYPVEIRATGVGWAFGAGRIGGIAGPVLGGAMLGANLTIEAFFTTLSIAALVIALLWIALDRLSQRTAASPPAPLRASVT